MSKLDKYESILAERALARSANLKLKIAAAIFSILIIGVAAYNQDAGNSDLQCQQGTAWCAK